MAHQDCLICEEDLLYYENSKELVCEYCHKTFTANVSCKNNHYVCDECHSAPAREIILTYCVNSYSKNPIQLANVIMKHPSVKMHGPEHHFIVPAVLLTAYYNTTDHHLLLKEKLNQANQRSRNILGGFCGFYGACGAAIGTGIFMSLITGSTPLSLNEWSFANNITANSLQEVAKRGGPRCCKRDTYISIIEAIIFIKEKFNVSLEKDEKIECLFNNFNAQCIFEKCSFYRRK